MRKGILLDESGDVLIKPIRDSDERIVRGLVIGESDYDHVRLIVESSKGDFKDYPVLGVGERFLKSVGRAADIRAEVQTQLELDGMKADVSVMSDGKMEINV